jgi:hypothetical protein
VSALKEAFPKDDPRPEQIRKLFAELQKVQLFQQSLYEWKELHNSLDDILTSFAPFSSEIHRADSEKVIPSSSALNNLWYAVSVKVDALLEFAAGIIEHANLSRMMTADPAFSAAVSELRRRICPKDKPARSVTP